MLSKSMLTRNALAGLFIAGVARLMASPVHAAQVDYDQSTITVQAPTRDITTTESRNANPDGTIDGDFLQLIKGRGTKENLKLNGKYNKTDDKEIYDLVEEGVSPEGRHIKAKLKITRDFTGGTLIETLRRTGEKTDEDLGGEPGLVQVTLLPGGESDIKIFSHSDADPKKDPPDHEFKRPIDQFTFTNPDVDLVLTGGGDTGGDGNRPPRPPGGGDPTGVGTDIGRTLVLQPPPTVTPPTVIVTIPPAGGTTPPAGGTTPTGGGPTGGKGAGPSAFCVAGSTRIVTPQGSTPVDQLHPGDLVGAYSEELRNTEWKPIRSIQHNQSAELLEVRYDGMTLRCTPTHPLVTLERGKVAAAELRPEDRLVVVHDGLPVSVKFDIRTLPVSAPVDVYDLKLENLEPYIFVGE